MKSYIKILLIILNIIIFGGCVPKNGISNARFDQIYAKKQVLVYDKTINLPENNWAVFAEFSPINKDELAVSLIKKDNKELDKTTHFALIDLNSGILKKDIKFDVNKDNFNPSFNYSDNGEKLYLKEIFERQEDNSLKKNFKLFTTLDLESQKLAPFNKINCDGLIPSNYNKDENIEVSCNFNSLLSKKNFKNNMGEYSYIEKNVRFGSGIVLYDNNFKAKKIVTADNRLDSYFIVDSISEDGQYVLFKESSFEKSESTNYKFIVYDLKNEKIIYNFENPFPKHKYVFGDFFIDKDTIIFRYYTGQPWHKDSKIFMGILNLRTGNKEIISNCSNGRCDTSNVAGIYRYNLNDRYMIWRYFSSVYVFDKKEMNIVQQFKLYGLEYAVSKKFKKVAFPTKDGIHIYNIVNVDNEK